MGPEKPPSRCLCGSESFARVRVPRERQVPYVTAFLRCTACSVMYYSPIPPADDFKPQPLQRAFIGHNEGMPPVPSGRPVAASHEDLMQDVREAAKEYRKPSRQPRPGDKDYRR